MTDCQRLLRVVAMTAEAVVTLYLIEGLHRRDLDASYNPVLATNQAKSFKSFLQKLLSSQVRL